MLRSVAVARIQRGLGFRTDQSDNIIQALQEAQRLLEQGRTLPFWLLTEDATFSLPAGTADVAFPTRFIREKRDEAFHYIDTDEELVRLEKLSLDVGRQRFVSEVPGKPLAYAMRVTGFKFWPERDIAYDLTWSYYAGAVVLDTDIENAWLANSPESLIGKAGMAIALDLKNKDAHDVFKIMYLESWAGSFAEGILREEENQPLYMGSKL